MNVGSTETQVTATTAASRSARDASAAGSAEVTDSPATFLDLLLQAAAPPPAAAAAVVAGVVAAADAADADPDDAVLEWMMPVLPPAPVLAAGPDAAAHSPATAGELPLAGALAPGDDKPPTPVPTLLAGAAAGAQRGSGEGAKVASLVDASSSAVSFVGPRVEATGNGGETQLVVRHVTTPVSDSRWPAHVGQEVRILVERGVQGATLRLTPEHLGPVDVRIDIVNDKASVVFNAAQADTRAALMDAIPKLREMFAGAGLTLGQADVRQDAPGGFASPGARPPARDALDGNRDDEAVSAVSTLRVGLVDAYA